MQQPTRDPLIDGVCLPAARHAEVAVPLVVVLTALVLLVERGADPTLAMGSLVAVIAAVGRLVRG
jgi:hypothetical protein